MRATKTKRIGDHLVSCTEMSGYDSLCFFDGVQGLWPLDSIATLGSKKTQELISNDQGLTEWILECSILQDEGFVSGFWNASGFLIEGSQKQPDDFTDLLFLFRTLLWGVEVSYSEALAMPTLDLPSDLKNAWKVIRNARKTQNAVAKQEETIEPTHSFNANGVVWEGVPPLIFTLCCSIHKHQRVDWQLLRELKTTFSFRDLLELHWMLESSKSFETAAELNSL